MRHANINDIKKIEQIIEIARLSLAKDGVDQWQKSNPNLDLIKKQIQKNMAYVYEKDGQVVGYAFISPEDEPDYEKLLDRFSRNTFFVIHTFMVDSSIEGAGSAFFREIIDFAEDRGIESIRIDTHNDNFRMKGLLEKFDFKYLGVIQVDEDGVKKDRNCYELVIS